MKKYLMMILLPLLCLVGLYYLGITLGGSRLSNEVNHAFLGIIALYFNLTLGFFLIANSFYLVILMLGYINARKQFSVKATGITDRLSPLKALKPISILVPCYNEEATIKESLYSMLRLDYPDYEVIVCNDGSKDSTLAIMINEYRLIPIEVLPPKVLPSKDIKAVYRSAIYSNLIVLDKENGGKADALNAAINFSQYPLICCVDSDSIIDPKGLVNVSLPYLENDDVIATGGTILLANTDSTGGQDEPSGVDTHVTSSWLGIIQSVEYLRAFLVGRTGWTYLGCDAIISGAFGLFRKSLVIRVGGYATNTIGEDMELLLRMQSYCLQHQTPYKIKILPNPVCWTEAPTDLTTLGNQRVRWMQGLGESLWAHRGMFFRRWSGRLGSIGLPYYFFFELLSAPIELIGYTIAAFGLGLGVFDVPMVMALFAATILFGCCLNLGAIVIDQLTFRKYTRFSDVSKLVLGSILEHFGFRQLHLYWRIKGLVKWAQGKQTWGEMKRVGIRSKTGKPDSFKKAA